MIKVRRQKTSVLSQGDIFRDIEMVESVDQNDDEIVVSKVVFPLVILLTQDCDLCQDFAIRWSQAQTSTKDKQLLSVLVSPLYNAEHVYDGTHLEHLGQTMSPINRSSSPGNNLRTNQNPRYHYLCFPEGVPIPPSVIDFKHYFSVSVPQLKKLKKTHFVRKVAEIYREDISQRFASYLSRIAIPERRKKGSGQN